MRTNMKVRMSIRLNSEEEQQKMADKGRGGFVCFNLNFKDKDEEEYENMRKNKRNNFFEVNTNALQCKCMMHDTYVDLQNTG